MTKHKILISRANCHQAAPGLLKTGLLKRVIRQSALISGLMLVGISTSYATPLEQAKRMHDRLAGIPPSNEMLCAMEYLIDPAGADDPTQAAYLVMSLNPAADANVPDFTNIPAGCGTVDNSASRKAFYSVSLKDYFTPWTNAAKSKHAPLNDATATLIGMVRDRDTSNGVPFTEALYGDIVYVPNGQSYNGSSNAQYETLENNNADLSESSVLTKTSQSTLPAAARAGLFSLRGTGEAFYSAGTNRRMIDYMMFNFICNGLLSSAAELSDATRPADRILQDTSRSPGGDSAVYLNSCIGCHAGMDPFKGGLAYYDWDELNGQVDYDSSAPQPKFLQNATVFKEGYVTTDDGWLNYWREGSNERLQWGWDAATTGAAPYQNAATDTDRVTSGNGAISFGQEIASTKAFAQCQVERAYEHVCLQKPVAADQTFLDGLVEDFKTTTGNHSVRWIFAKVAPLCMGD